ncbi:hypothetical protein C6341_g23914 [Phytophthora cactorum]|nr:hypothetical protein C6341_g23914 [Phytophthora cactorum]
MTFELAAKATRLRPARDSSFDLSSKNASNRKCDCIQSTGHYSLKPYASKRPDAKHWLVVATDQGDPYRDVHWRCARISDSILMR